MKKPKDKGNLEQYTQVNHLTVLKEKFYNFTVQTQS